jgi:hypothetical protein
MKPHQNRHHLTQTQAVGATGVRAGTGRQLWVLRSEQRAAKIINITKDGYNIQAELPKGWVWRPTVDPIYHIPKEFCFCFIELTLL